MSYKNTTFGKVKKYEFFYYNQQRWYKNTSMLERTKHNAYTSDGMHYKWFNSNTRVKVEV